MTVAALKWLQENELLEWNSNLEYFVSTKLGKACMTSALSPTDALVCVLLNSLVTLLGNFRTTSPCSKELHIIL